MIAFFPFDATYPLYLHQYKSKSFRWVLSCSLHAKQQIIHCFNKELFVYTLLYMHTAPTWSQTDGCQGAENQEGQSLHLSASFFTVCIIPSNKSDRRLPALSLLSFSFSYTNIYINTQWLYRCGPHCDMGMWLVKESCITLPHGCRDTHLHKTSCMQLLILYVCLHQWTHTNTHKHKRRVFVLKHRWWDNKIGRLAAINIRDWNAFQWKLFYTRHQIVLVNRCLHVPSPTSCVKTCVQH